MPKSIPTIPGQLDLFNYRSRRRQMPRCEDVISYWGPELTRLGKVDDGELEQCFSDKEPDGSRLQKGICFACGFIRPLERAHIKARISGGGDEVDNIHLLCVWCHRLSEGLEGNSYWEWFKSQNQWTCLWQMAAAFNPAGFAEAITTMMEANYHPCE